MLLSRRIFTISLTLAASEISRAFGAEERGLFWTATAPEKQPCVLFGYARTAAAVTPDIVKDGDRFAGEAQRLVADVANIQLPRIAMPRDKLAPVVSRVSTATAERIRAVLDKSFPSLPTKEKLSGFEVVFFLLAEGQTPPKPSVGGMIAESAQAAGKPIVYLVAPEEVKAAYHPPDLIALDQRVDENALNYLLTFRDTNGPIGKYEQDLYAARRTADLAKLAAEMKQHGVPTSAEFLPTTSLEGTIIDRTLQAVQTAQDRTFLMLPVGSLTRDGGILSKLRENNVQVALSA
jgi:hypothetical protein